MKTIQLFCILVLVSSAGAQTWFVEVVDPTEISSCTSLALDSSGRPHIAYTDKTNSNLCYTRWNGTSWEIDTIVSVYYFGAYPSLVLDSSDDPHISYTTGPYGDLCYASWNGSSWELETVDSCGSRFISLELDSSEYPHISYEDCIEQTLKYARWNGSSWEVETVDSIGLTGRYTSLELDSSGNPHISYNDALHDELRYAHWNGTSWEITAFPTPGNVQFQTSLALDSSDYPRITFVAGSPSGTYYTRWDGTGWETETVGDVGWFTSLALDSLDNPCIAYGTIMHQLLYTYWDGSEWITEIVDSEYTHYALVSMALDGSGNPHISYSINQGIGLRYACRSETGIEEGAGIGSAFEMLSVAPNPFGSTCEIVYSLPVQAQVSLSVYDLSGRLVYGSDVETCTAGVHAVSWHPVSETPDGCYLIVLDAGGKRAVRRAVLLR